MIYQKVYITLEHQFQKHFKGIQILDICDPDFKDSPDIFIKETLDTMDGVVVPTEEFKTFLETMTDTPIRVIKDRFDMSEFPDKKIHRGTAKTCVWFGYEHNAASMRFAIQSLEKRGLKLIVISDQDPMPYRWADKPKEYDKLYTYVKYKHPDAYKEIQKADIAILPPNSRPFDRFKSENKTIISQLLGVPVAVDAEQLDNLITAESRNKAIDTVYEDLKKSYNCKKSVDEYKELIYIIMNEKNK